LESIRVSDDEEKKLRMGQRVALEPRESEEIAALNDAGHLVGVLRRRGDSWQPVVILPGVSETSE